MKIVVTGTTGFVGGVLAEHFRNQGHEVHSHTRQIRLDWLLNEVQPDLIVHCASEIYDPKRMFESNVVMTNKILEHALEHRCQVINFGSSSEYGWVDEVTDEASVLAPNTSYAATKAAATMLLSGVAVENELDIVTLRPYSIYGPGEKPHRLFPKLWMAYVKQQPMRLVEGVHDFIYIKDLVSAVDAVMNSDSRIAGEILNLCSGVQTLNSELIEIFESVTGNTAPVEFDGTVFSTCPVWQGDNTLLCTHYNWQPEYDLKAGIEDFVKYAYYDNRT